MHDCLKIKLGGEDICLSSRRCLWWSVNKTLIVSDLHLGKGIAFSRNANLLPPYDTADTLTRLRELVEEIQPNRVICLGDNFHHRKSFRDLQEFERQMIHDLVKLVPEWIWIMGNHDSELPTGLWGMKLEDLTDMPFRFYHQPNAYDQLSLQIVGHYHPKYTTSLKGRHLSKPCFAWSQSILIMPSFGSYTGGLKVDHPEIIKVLGDGFQIATADTIPRPILIIKR